MVFCAGVGSGALHTGDYGRVTIRVDMPLLAPLIHRAQAVWVVVSGNWRPTEEHDDASPPWLMVTFIQSCRTHTQTLKQVVNEVIFHEKKEKKRCYLDIVIN